MSSGWLLRFRPVGHGARCPRRRNSNRQRAQRRRMPPRSTVDGHAERRPDHGHEGPSPCQP
eukprot:11195332-Lingulodinium_polyedra.AAC.1